MHLIEEVKSSASAVTINAIKSISTCMCSMLEICCAYQMQQSLVETQLPSLSISTLWAPMITSEQKVALLETHINCLASDRVDDALGTTNHTDLILMTNTAQPDQFRFGLQFDSKEMWLSQYCWQQNYITSTLFVVKLNDR